MVPPDRSRRTGHRGYGDDHRSQRLLVQRAGEQLDLTRDRPAHGRQRLLHRHEGTRHDRARRAHPGRVRQRAPPAAQNIDIEGADFATRIAALDKNATYAVYCRSGNRSGTALEQMSAAGFTHVYDLAGGIGAWQNMGGPMTMGGS